MQIGKIRIGLVLYNIFGPSTSTLACVGEGRVRQLVELRHHD
jgi:hypothetical protein